MTQTRVPRPIIFISTILAALAAALAVCVLLQIVGADMETVLHGMTIAAAIVLARSIGRRWRRS